VGCRISVALKVGIALLLSGNYVIISLQKNKNLNNTSIMNMLYFLFYNLYIFNTVLLLGFIAVDVF